MQELPASRHQIHANAHESGPSGDPPGPDEPDRRRVLAAGALGVTAFVLPTSLAAASPAVDGAAGGLAAPTSVTAQPIGYVSAGSTGGIRVAWSPVTGAGSYEVRWSLASVNGPYADGTITTSDTTVDLAGLPGTDTTDHGAGSNGAPNTGDGGGSGSMNESVIPSVNFKGSDGGSGIVIVRCPMAA